MGKLRPDEEKHCVQGSTASEWQGPPTATPTVEGGNLYSGEVPGECSPSCPQPGVSSTLWQSFSLSHLRRNKSAKPGLTVIFRNVQHNAKCLQAVNNLVTRKPGPLSSEECPEGGPWLGVAPESTMSHPQCPTPLPCGSPTRARR